MLSRNLRRRHLSGGQKAAIALEWSEQVELGPNVEEKARRGRPKGALSNAAQKIGISEQRVFEMRRIREQSATLYQEVKAGNRSLNSALAEISQPRETLLQDAKVETPGMEEDQGRSLGAKKANAGVAKAAEIQRTAFATPASRAAIEKSLNRIKEILGSWFYAEVRGGNLIEKPEEIVQFAKLTEAQMREIGPLLKRGWTFVAAFREVIERLTSDDEIRALHTRAVASGGNWCLLSVGNFGHIVVWGAEKDKTLAKIKDTLARPSAPQGS